jgi:hypothetical protein
MTEPKKPFLAKKTNETIVVRTGVRAGGGEQAAKAAERASKE